MAVGLASDKTVMSAPCSTVNVPLSDFIDDDIGKTFAETQHDAQTLAAWSDIQRLCCQSGTFPLSVFELITILVFIVSPLIK